MAALEIQGKDVSLKELKPLLIPLGAILLLIVLFYIAITQGLNQIDDRRTDLSTNRKNENVLEQKQQVLSSQSTDVENFVNVTTNALPAKNASLIMSSQLKELASQRLLSLTDLQIGRDVSSGSLNRAHLQFSVDGDLDQVIAFIKELSDVAPLSRLDLVTFIQSGDIVRADVSISAYSSSFPEQLPAVTDPIADLTDKEREVLGILGELDPPPFSAVSPETPGVKSNPFE